MASKCDCENCECHNCECENCHPKESQDQKVVEEEPEGGKVEEEPQKIKKCRCPWENVLRISAIFLPTALIVADMVTRQGMCAEL